VLGRASRVLSNHVEADNDIDDDVDAAYRAKYRRYAGSILNSVLTAGGAIHDNETGATLSAQLVRQAPRSENRGWSSQGLGDHINRRAP